jgi:3-oxoacyl-[acyl-carrier protein] reductase
MKDDVFAIITGSNRGIGKCIMDLFLERNFNIIACSRKPDVDFENYLKKLEEKWNRRVIPVFFDMEHNDQVKSAIKLIISLKVNVEVLVNNAGIASGGLFQMTTIQEMSRVMNVNFFSQILFTQGIVKLMIKSKKGSIVNITSVAGIIGDKGTLVYGASKAAMNFSTKVLASELGIFNIRVNAIAPSITRTDMFDQMTLGGKERLISNSALNRVAEPEEVAKLAYFLASDESEFLTGQIIRFDGGIL